MAMASTRTPADVVFKGHTGDYRANSHKTKPNDTHVCFRNMTGSPVRVWFPGNFLLGSPLTLDDSTETRCLEINPEAASGTYTYAAQVTATGEFIKGNSPPEVIIDR
ncbi:MAG TPA: hypothetical protein VJ648_14750 [Vicinamibacteria bacterium]|nr:hypothetical protein [Vicinamibacteria bacterium]